MTINNMIIHTEFIVTTDGFNALREEWDNLLENSLSDNPFLSHQWLQSWWEVYGNGELQIITCRDTTTEELVGILALHCTKVLGVLPVTMLRFMGSCHVSSDFMDCIVRKGWEQSVYKACLDTLQHNASQWDVFLLQDMDQDTPFFRYMKNAGIQGMEIVHDPGKICPYLELPDAWGTLLDGLSKKVRQRVGYNRRALTRIGTLELEQVSDPTALPQALVDMVRLRQDRMDQKGLASAKVSDKYLQFHSQLMPRHLACNRLRLYFLNLDGRRIAYLYLFAGSDRIYFYQTGFDRIWSRNSVGFVLLGMVIEQSIVEGCKSFEFLRGDEGYKYDWGEVRVRQLADVMIPGRTLSAKFWLMKRKMLKKVKIFIMRIQRNFIK